MKIRPLFVLFTLASAVVLNAAPKLRLSQSAIGPIVIAQGANGPAISLAPCAYNAGDGSLNLTLTSSATWLTASLGPQATCPTGQTGNQVKLTLSTASLSKGAYTGIVTLADPNAVDSPQTITVTVDIGGGVPDSLTFYTAPGGSGSAVVNTTTDTVARASTQSNGPWLSVAAGNVGSFQFALSYGVTASAANLGAGDYTGSIGFTNSSVTSDNKTVPVTLHVTTQPILQPAYKSMVFNMAQGAAKETPYIVLGNAGQGTLTLNSVTATTASGTWLTATLDTTYNLVNLTADPTGLSPGTYTGSVTVTSNAANSPTTIPVTLNVLATGPPLISYQGVLNVFTNSPDDGLAQGTVAAVYGALCPSDPTVRCLRGGQFTTGAAQINTLPLSTNFDGIQVLLNGTPIPVQYVDPGQINIQIPYDAAVGDGTLTVVRNGTQGNSVSVHIAPIAPVLLPLGNYVVAQIGGTANLVGYSPGVPAHVGDVLVLYAVGLGATSPAVTAGAAAPSSPLAQVVPTPILCFGDPNPINPFKNCITPDFVGLTPGFFGLYQINFKVAASLPTGDAIPIFLQQGNVRSNILSIAIH